MGFVVVVGGGGELWSCESAETVDIIGWPGCSVDWTSEDSPDCGWPVDPFCAHDAGVAD